MTLPAPGAWTPDELAASGQHLVELPADLVRLLARSLPTEFVLPDGPDADAEFRDRMAPRLGPIAGDIARRLGPGGPGLAIVTGPGLADLGAGQLTGLLFGLSTVLGRPIGQNTEDERIVSVVDERPARRENARGYQTNGNMLMHTDPTDVAALLCLSQSATGGGSVLASVGTVLDALTDKAPELVHEYFRLWDWDLRGVQREGAARVVPTPIFSVYRGTLSCRYGSTMLRERASDPRDTMLLDLFDEVAQQPGLLYQHTLRPGEIMWLNNYRVLHGRSAFTDDDASGMVRRLLRTWIWLHERPVLASSFWDFSEAIDRGGLSRG